MIEIQPGQIWTDIKFTSKSQNYIVTSKPVYLHDEQRPDAIPMIIYRSEDCRFANAMDQNKFLKKFRMVGWVGQII